ncbi:zinc finger protein 142-like isoform X2 [Ornithodoros turicata]|uniref:zinc finger protein 142-like isoform X2 n=2 Tax=Ornithodoros turicata TaxID=34597 RepID=UPI0031390686
MLFKSFNTTLYMPEDLTDFLGSTWRAQHWHRRSIHRLNSANVCEVCGRLCDSQDDLVSHTSSEHPELLDGLLKRLEAKKARYARQASLIAQSGEGSCSVESSSRIEDLMHDYAQPTPMQNGVQQVADREEEDDEEEEEATTTPVKRPLEEDSSSSSNKKGRTGRRTYSCVQCGLTTKWPREFLAHRKDVHGDRITIHDCPFCEYASKQPQKLQRHCNIVHKDEMQRGEATMREATTARKTVVAGFARDTFYKCGQCSFQAKSRFLVAEHERTSHLKKRFFRCLQCGYVSHDRARYARHLRHHNLPKVKCPHCDFRTAYRWNMDRHMKYHTSEGNFQCDKCVYKTMSRQSLTAHCLHHHNDNLKELSDTEVGGAGPTEGDTDDNRLMIDERPQEKQPQQQQTRNPPLKLTLRRSGGIIESKPSSSSTSAISMIKCRYCPQKMMWPSEMKKHDATHFKMTKKHGCPMCDVRFDRLEHMEAHILKDHRKEETPQRAHQANGTRQGGSPIRTTSTPIIIELGKSDDARRASSSGRTLDIPIKSKQALHRCTTCGYTTRWISELKKHELVHGTTKPFNCKYCSYSSRWKGDITRHVFRMHKDHVGDTDEEEDPKSSHVLRFLLSQPQESGEQQQPAAPEVKTLVPNQQQKKSVEASPYQPNIEYVPKAPSGQIPKIVKKFKCPQCSFLTRTASRFHVHMIQHLNKRPFMCSTCHYRSNWQWDVNKHIKSKSNNDTDHKNAELIVMDETGFKNYAKYQIYLVDVEESPKGDRILELTEKTQQVQHVDPTDAEETENIVVTPDIVYPDQEEQGSCSASEAPPQAAFYCGHCNFSNLDKRTVVNHLGTHAGNRPYKCRICDFVSKWYHLVLMHVRHRHSGTVRDVESRVSYVEEGNILRIGEDEPEKQHSIANDGDSRTFRCNICPYRCAKLCHMEFHMKQHTQKEGAIFKCEYCPYYVKFKKTLARHQMLHKQKGEMPIQSNKKLPASSVSLQTSDTSRLDTLHKSPKHPLGSMFSGQVTKRHICEQCPYTSDNKTQYLYHKQFHRPNKHAPFKCTHCSYWSTHNHLMAQHMKIHKPSDPVKVQPEISMTSSIPTTIAIVNGAPRKMFKCRFCPLMNKRRANVKVHERMHIGMKNARFQCVLCSYKCNNTGVLASHMKLHKAENPDLDVARMRMFCDNLNSLTTPATNRVETSPSPVPQKIAAVKESAKSPHRKKIFSYFCEKCPAMFKSHTDLDTHKTYHSSPYPYHCHLCDYRARHKPHLHKHLLVHTPEYAERQNGFTLAEIRNQDRQQSPAEPDDPLPSGAADQMLLLEEAETRAFVDASSCSTGPPQNTPTKVYRCNRCPASFQKATTLEYHVSLHGSAGVYACHFCNYAANSAANVNAHSQLHYRGALKQRQPPKLFRCHKCPASFSKQNRYESHLTLHGRNERFRCSHCDYAVKFAANLVKHRKLHEGMPPEPVALSSVASSSAAASPAVITLSSQSSTPDRSEKAPLTPVTPAVVEEKVVYGCSRCPYTYHRRETVLNHLKHHGTTDGICCSYCDFYAASVSVMRDHVRIHFQLTRRVKPQAFMASNKVEILYVSASEKNMLLFGDAGEGCKGDRFYPDDIPDEEVEEIPPLVTIKQEVVEEECSETRDDESTIVDVASLEEERQCESIEEDYECDEITAASRQALEDLLTNVVTLTKNEDSHVSEPRVVDVVIVPEPPVQEVDDMTSDEPAMVSSPKVDMLQSSDPEPISDVAQTTQLEGDLSPQEQALTLSPKSDTQESAEELLNMICYQNGMDYEEGHSPHSPTEEVIVGEVECETVDDDVVDECHDEFMVLDEITSSHGTSITAEEDKNVSDVAEDLILDEADENKFEEERYLEHGNSDKPLVEVETINSAAEDREDVIEIEDTVVEESIEEHVEESIEEHVEESIEEHVEESIEEHVEESIEEHVEEEHCVEDSILEGVDDKSNCPSDETSGDVLVPEDVFKMQSPNKGKQAASIENENDQVAIEVDISVSVDDEEQPHNVNGIDASDLEHTKQDTEMLEQTTKECLQFSETTKEVAEPDNITVQNFVTTT